MLAVTCAEGHKKPLMLSVNMLNVVMMSVVALKNGSEFLPPDVTK